MPRLRRTATSDDLLVYADDDYLIFRKHGYETGSLAAPFDVVAIGIDGLLNCRILMKNEDEWRQAVGGFIDRLKELQSGWALPTTDLTWNGIEMMTPYGYKIERGPGEGRTAT